MSKGEYQFNVKIKLKGDIVDYECNFGTDAKLHYNVLSALMYAVGEEVIQDDELIQVPDFARKETYIINFNVNEETLEIELAPEVDQLSQQSKINIVALFDDIMTDLLENHKD